MNNTNLKFKDILYHILDNGDIGNGWKYVEVVDKKGGFSLPKCLYYKGESMKNLLEYSDYINHLDTGKGFINDFVKDIFRECYPGSTNPICKIKENVMMGGAGDGDGSDGGEEEGGADPTADPTATGDATAGAGGTGDATVSPGEDDDATAGAGVRGQTAPAKEGGQLCSIEQIVKTIESPTLLKEDFDRILKVVYTVGSDKFYNDTPAE